MKWLGSLDASHEGEDGHDGVLFLTSEGTQQMAKAESNTVYTLNGHRFRIKAGDPIPEGAVLDEERSVEKAPENRAAKAAPTNRSAKNIKKDA